MNPLSISDISGLEATLIMFRQAPENKHCSFLFVEGDSDEKFWQTRIAEKDCCIVFLVAFSKNNAKQTGKTAVIKNVATLNQTDLQGYLGIVDDDFDTLFKFENENNICVTETHDLETLLLSSATVFKTLLVEFGDHALIAQFEHRTQKTVQDYLLELTLPFAEIEWLKQNLQPRLKLINLHKNNTILSSDKWCLNQNNIDLIIQKKGIDPTTLASKQHLAKLNNINPWLLCNGHILIDILSIGFQYGAIGNNKTATSNNIARHLRAAYPKEDFYRTALYQSILNWQNNVKPYQIFNPAN
jgi:hypothetical protein